MSAVETIDGVYLFGVPVPPSSNHQYATIIRHGKPIRIPSKETKQYETEFKIWALKNNRALSEARKTILDWAMPISVSMYVCLKRERLVTKDGRLKRLDVSNRCKALHDLLSESLAIDDSYFTSIPIEKVVADNCSEQVIVALRPHRLRSVSNIDIFATSNQVLEISHDHLALIQAKLPRS